MADPHPRWEAPAKLNLSLRVAPPTADGYHPLDSLVQTIELLDLLEVEEAEEDRLVVEGAELPTGGDNLVWRAVATLAAEASRPALAVRLVKRIPVCAGLGGGSADAAAALAALAERITVTPTALTDAAARVGADVPFFLTGGSARMGGYGERIERLPPLSGFAVAVAVPPFELPTPEVYRRWDGMEGPAGPGIDARHLPPSLRQHAPLINDLTPAATSLRPELGDWIEELSRLWERPVAMSGSGPSLFGFFADIDEAEGAAGEAPPELRAAQAADLRPAGVTPEGEQAR